MEEAGSGRGPGADRESLFNDYRVFILQDEKNSRGGGGDNTYITM